MQSPALRGPKPGKTTLINEDKRSLMNKENWENYLNALKMQDWETAKNALLKILQAEQKNPQIHLKLGDIYQRTGDSVNAIASYQHAARLLQSQGFLQKAIALYKIILALDPYNSEAISRSKELMMDIETFRMSQTSVPASESMEAFASGFEAKTPDLINSALFYGMPEEETQQILKGLPQQTFPGNTKVIEEGDSGDSMYIIKSGRAMVIAHLFGKELKLATLETGDVFGEVAFLTGRTRTASVISDGPLEVYEISRFELEEIIDRNPPLLQKLEDFYECRVQDTIKKIQS